ncbi:hypothetical protein [Streptomyces sp. NPDC059894]|uniref:hypothetical protein n=1 Tax=unclassified Streptomyces TaxID=2593676 RepID=UPI0036668636
MNSGGFAAPGKTSTEWVKPSTCPPLPDPYRRPLVFTAQTLAAAGELQRGLQREPTYDGLRAAEAKAPVDPGAPAPQLAASGPTSALPLDG